MKTLLIAALTSLAITAHAADIVVPIESVIVPSAAVSDVVAWLETQELVTVEVVITYGTNIVHTADGPIEEYVPTTTRVRTVVPETPKEKLARIIRAAGVAKVRAELKQMRKARAEVVAQAEADALPDPVAEEIE